MVLDELIDGAAGGGGLTAVPTGDEAEVVPMVGGGAFKAGTGAPRVLTTVHEAKTRKSKKGEKDFMA